MRVTYHPYLRPKFASDAHGTLYIRVTCQRKHFYINSFIYLERAFWNEKKGIVLPSCPNCQGLNDLIAMEIAKVRRNLIDFRLKGKEVNFMNLKKLYTLGSDSAELIDLVQTYNKETNVSITRKRHMTTAVNHALSRGVPSTIQLIRQTHMRELKNALSKTLKKNTMLSIMKRLKSLFNYAVTNEIIEKNPMEGLLLGEFESKIGFLTENEIHVIAATLPNLSPELIKVGKMFLFCCYTGLRFGDAMNLKNCKILETDHGRAIYFEAMKTRKKQYIPLMAEADRLFDDVKKNKVYQSILQSVFKRNRIICQNYYSFKQSPCQTHFCNYRNKQRDQTGGDAKPFGT